ncbi:MAG: C1 family peptidase [bacterium]
MRTLSLFPKSVLSLLLLLSCLPVLAEEPVPAEALEELARIRETITRLGQNWEADINPIALLPREERLALCGGQIVEGPHSAPVVGPCNKDLPTAINWRDNGGNWVTPVRNQGSCGSCWIFGSVAAFESFWMIASGVPDQISLDFAEQHVLSCGPNPTGCDGGFITEALSSMKNNGICDEACFPYVANQLPCSAACPDIDERLVWLGDYTDVVYGSPDIIPIKEALQNGPVVTSYNVHENFYYYSSGVYSAYGSPSTGEGHVVAIVGYDDDLQAWLAKNSWGRYWAALDGYFWIAYDNGCGFGVYTYTCLPPNNEPVLSDADLDPATGMEGATFTWSVLYTDDENDTPTLAAVTLRNPVTGGWVNHNLATSDTTFTDGAIFTLAMALSDTGTYQYRFNFVNEYGQTITLPESPNQFDGPVVTPWVNQNPTLTDPLCDPDPSLQYQPCTFSVVYSDAENDCPTLATQLNLWSPESDGWTVHTLASADSSYDDGSLYSCEVVLTEAGSHEHYYLFINEATQFVRLPADAGENLPGPLVVPATPVHDSTGGLPNALLPPSPNPANPGVELRYHLAQPSAIQFRLYDPAGRLVRELASGPQPAGAGVVFWDGRDDTGRAVASGVYLARLVVHSGGASERFVTKLNLVR